MFYLEFNKEDVLHICMFFLGWVIISLLAVVSFLPHDYKSFFDLFKLQFVSIVLQDAEILGKMHNLSMHDFIFRLCDFLTMSPREYFLINISFNFTVIYENIFELNSVLWTSLFCIKAVTVYFVLLYRTALCFLGVFLITKNRRRTKTFEPYVTMDMTNGLY